MALADRCFVVPFARLRARAAVRIAVGAERVRSLPVAAAGVAAGAAVAIHALVLALAPAIAHAQPQRPAARAAGAPPVTPALVVRPEHGPMAAQGSFGFASKADSLRRSVSGIACPQREGNEYRCVIAFDEGAELRLARLTEDTYQISSAPIALGAPGTELDAEGATSDGRGNLYVTGSHAHRRSDCVANPASRAVWRIPYSPNERITALALSGATAQATDSVWQSAQRRPDLGAGRCLGSKDGGLDIEGLAWYDGRLAFGLRQGSAQGRVRWLSFDAQALFANEPVSMIVHSAPLGRGAGIRDLTTVADGVLMLIGPDDDPANAGQPWRIALWEPRRESLVTELATLELPKPPEDGCSRDVKPEAMMVLDESPQQYRVIVLSDGLCDGGPMRFTIPRRR